ncbi:MAG: hypothetical protein EOO77_36600 [Oxalobacteraceae bacterium]|jgi:hypothetical protein|nr:MAG: hypothetical protein EOO77_36600 [Oxalobacteraceae bacterium]
MDRKFTSLLDELSHSPIRDKSAFIEHRGEQCIASVVNLMKLLRESYPEEVATDLCKRLINGIRTGDAEKFKRGVKATKKKGD